MLVGPLLFFSSLAFTVLENAMSVIFYHRVAIQRRSLLGSLLIPFVWIFFLALGTRIVTFVSGALQAMGRRASRSSAAPGRWAGCRGCHSI